ncbi:hypothetical protein TVAG_354860 [Trichomonas vaginalis G3]|uniref:Uncharacterized protein n=1 Tax=Trichomonas vaginalis (strain ATCC PRA-98 / G3) TaxID=412133 RepID=A2EFX1_TRIV3|nr:hypothetical protein TVAGG3_0516150 [Trichomonas vaginalis G3]EAY08427.1 hypothetical protein TVAG_354860 [Trichomonas vaginalis G3]KAI5518141.1 hypothetical protein TVAGG3_0516150 [Trichomonas vaginalis G3]|eukprot:XP_001320650.1 hypothetical protein [Trichomonas vaginalis G3]
MEESNFGEFWSWFGFKGQPDPDIEYTWFRIQDSLTFDGIKNIITDCTIYYSSRKPNHYLIKQENGVTEIWDITECQFRIIPEFPSSIEVSSGKRLFILWGVSSSFIEFLVQDHKLMPTPNLKPAFNTIPIKYSRVSIKKDPPHTGEVIPTN